MQLRSVRHKGLRRLIEDDDPRGLRPDMVNGIRNILVALIAARDIDAAAGPPRWRLHRKETWSISATGNWRITFTVEAGEVYDLDLEDDH